LRFKEYELVFWSVRKTRGDESRFYVLHIAINLVSEIKHLNK